MDYRYYIPGFSQFAFDWRKNAIESLGNDRVYLIDEDNIVWEPLDKYHTKHMGWATFVRRFTAWAIEHGFLPF